MGLFKNKNFENTRERLGLTISKLQTQATLTGNEQLGETVSDLSQRLHDPFMFVVVGEVKAGKSSFINALLESDVEIAPTSPAPMTDRIQQIVYGDTDIEVEINPYLIRHEIPLEILREIAIVDTPGTNTIVEHHQEITERFIPVADLIIFVFEAKNPYRQSAWQFFDFINTEWRKKIIFILQQKDLMSPEDLAVNVAGLTKFAQEKGIADPEIFSVSAKEELDGKYDQSGFSGLRDYIRTHITGGKAPAQKLMNSASTAEDITARINQGLDKRKEQWNIDVQFRNDTRETLDNHTRQSNQYIELLTENVLSTFDTVTNNTKTEIHEGLSFPRLVRRSIGGLFGKKYDLQEWIQETITNMEKKLNSELPQQINKHLGNVSDSIQDMARSIDDKIRSSNTVLKADEAIFANIAEHRSKVYQELQETFSKFINESDNFKDDTLLTNKKNYSPALATGSGLAIVGVLLAAFTSGAVLDITGGLLTTAGIVFAGFSAGFQRRKVLKEFDAAIVSARERLHVDLQERLQTYVYHVRDRIDDNFNNFDAMLTEEKTAIQKYELAMNEISSELRSIKSILQVNT